MNDEQLAEVESLLAEPIDTDNGHILASQLSTIEAWGATVAKATYLAKAELAKMSDKCRMPKTPGTTDFDRTIMLEAAVADYDAKYEYLAQLLDTIKRRITLGQSILRSMRAEVEANL